MQTSKPTLRIGSLGAICCPRCDGTGKEPEPIMEDEDCSSCHGDGFIEEPTEDGK